MASSKHGKTGLAHHAATVAFTPARSLTSHVRRRYQERYKGRYRFFRFVFGFDIFLVGIAAALFLFDAVLLIHALLPSDPGIALTLQTPPLRASDTIPVVATLRVTDGRTHEDVSLRWKLPAWVDVVSADPAMEKGGLTYIGNMRPGQDRALRLLVRIKAFPGTKLPFSFSVRQFGAFGIPLVHDGSEERIVQSGVLSATPAVEAGSILSGGSFPLVLANVGSATATLVTLRLTVQDGAPDARFGSGDVSVFVRDLAPRERRILFVDVGRLTSKKVRLGWEVQDGAQVVQTAQRELSVVQNIALSSLEPLRIRRDLNDAALSFSYRSTGIGRALVVVPGTTRAVGAEPFLLYGLEQGEHPFSLSTSLPQGSGEWHVFLIDDTVEGNAYGMHLRALLSAAFSFRAEARYYTDIGDQIGIGPLPPRVGEKTTYWIVWTVGPTESDMTQLVMKTVLPSTVRATGKFASAARGVFQTDGRSVTWSVLAFPATGGESVSFAFEVELTPTESDRGHPVPLLLDSSARALDAETGELREASAGSDTTDVPRDAKAAGKGVVR